MLRFHITEYRHRLRGAGHTNVPTGTDLARVLGIDPKSFSRLANNNRRGPNREQIGLILDEFRRRGFDTVIDDLFEYIPDEN